jgi:hypothetical protein
LVCGHLIQQEWFKESNEVILSLLVNHHNNNNIT